MKIFLFTAAIIFVNILLFLQCFDAFSKWATQNRRFKVEKINDVPFQHLTLFRLPGQKSDFLFGVKDTDPEYTRLYFFSPFHEKTIVDVGVFLDITIPRDFYYKTFQVIDDYNNGEPVLPIFGIEKKKIILELRDVDGNTLDRINLENLSIKPPSTSGHKSFPTHCRHALLYRPRVAVL